MYSTYYNVNTLNSCQPMENLNFAFQNFLKFFSSIFNLWLAEPSDAEPVNTEDPWVYLAFQTSVVGSSKRDGIYEWLLVQPIAFLYSTQQSYVRIICRSIRTSLMAQMVKNQPTMWETQVLSLSWEDPLEMGMQPTPVFLPGEFHGQKSLVGYRV